MSTGRPGDEVPDGAQLNIARDQATQHIVQHGNLYVGGAPNYRVDAARPRPPEVPPVARRQPSRLLAARYQVVDFTGREAELAELAAWRDDPARGPAVRLVHGPGGQGKTRLVAQFAQQSTQLGWTVAQAVHRSYDTALTASLGPAVVAGSPGLLLIVDYAERWPLSDLLTLAQDPLLRAGVPIRVLLLSRPAGLWWESLSHHLADRFEMDASQTTLRSLADSTQARTAVFTAARDRFADLLDVSDPDRISAPERLGEDAFGLVLTVHMAALAAVDADARGESPPSDPAGLSAYLLSRERAHWQAMYDNDHRVHTAPQTLARAVFTATLTRPLSYPDGVDVLRRVGIPNPEQVLDDHRLCYPPGDPATVCEPLYPDRLGEDFLALSTPGHNHTAHEADPWADTAVARLLLHTGSEKQRLPDYGPQALAMLIEAAHRWPHIAQCQLFPLLREHPGLALAAGGAALTRLAHIPDVDLGVLEAIEPLLPSGRHVDLDLAITAVISRLTQHRLATADQAGRARLLTNLGYRLNLAGRREDALAATTEATDLYRHLATTNPTAHTPNLALSLNNLGNALSDLGRREQALTATTEATDIRRQLATTNPTAHTPTLAMALNNLGARLSDLGRHDDALTATTEATDIGRQLATTNPTAHTPTLAMALNNLGNVLSNLGQHDDALTATTEATDIGRQLATTNPTAHTPDLAMALNNLGILLSNLGRHDDALTATTEATDIRRQLATTNPTAFTRDLAGSLNNLGATLSNLGQHDDALTATTEATDLYRQLATTNPTTYTPDLARGLWGFARVRATGQIELPEALGAARESVVIYEQLPQAFIRDLRGALGTLAQLFDQLGRDEDALKVRQRIDQLSERG